MAQEHVRDGVIPYPFSAIVGNDRPKGALRCALSSPDISSMLICGPKGSGKTVLARSASGIGGSGTVTVPLNATEDGIFGGMDLEDTLRDGRVRSSAGLLARADGNILLMENINLFPEHIVHQVLNAAETRASVVERDGISEYRESCFLLIATMDAEEGGLSDHLLDRFDICVFMDRTEDESLRAEIVGRRMAYESDPAGFSDMYAEADAAVASEIAKARSRVRFTRVPEGYCGAISEVCTRLNVAGHRGDIAVMNASCAIAALDDRDFANLDDLKEAAAICLEHRRNDPDESQEQEQQEQEPPEPPEQPDEGEGQDDDTESQTPPEDGPEEEPDDRPDLPPPPVPPEPSQEEVFSIGDVYRVIDYMPKERVPQTGSRAGRHTETASNDMNGRCIGYRIPQGRVRDIALTASIRAAAPYQILRDHSELAVVLKRDDLREKVRERRQGRNILFLVDGSGSIGAQKRMVAVKGAILSMLRDAYQKRDSIGMAVFRTDHAEEVLPLTRSILKAYHVLSEIPTGGRTPLTHGLIKGHEILREHISRDCSPVMVILSDGRCNVSYTPGLKPFDEMISTARALSDLGIRFIVIDTEFGRLRFGMALDLCRALNGTYLKLEDLNADYIERSVRMVIDS